jgi:hypothetical protein
VPRIRFLACLILGLPFTDASAPLIRLRNLVLPEKMSGQITSPKLATNARVSGLQLIQP